MEGRDWWYTTESSPPVTNAEKIVANIRLMTLAPGHFHAALVHKEMHPSIYPKVYVYGPLDADLIAHMERVNGLNGPLKKNLSWRLDVRAGDDWLQRFIRECPGNVAVISGQNQHKIDLMHHAIANSVHILADKPWIIEADDMTKLEDLLFQAQLREVLSFDMMTERHEITNILQRELIMDRDIFGVLKEGTPDEPAVFMESVHYLKKLVAGQPLRRPEWFFDIQTQGEGLTDVGTHLVDLAMWLVFPDQVIDYRADIKMISGERWPTVLDVNQYRDVTGKAQFHDSLASAIQNDRLHYFCNNRVKYAIRGYHVQLDVLWDYEATSGGDTHQSTIRGTFSHIKIRQGKNAGDKPELIVTPTTTRDCHGVGRSLERKLESWQTRWPGLKVVPLGIEYQVFIPDALRIGHEAHFARVVDEFLHYIWNPRSMPKWEMPNLLAKYYVTTQGVAMGRSGASVGA